MIPPVATTERLTTWPSAPARAYLLRRAADRAELDLEDVDLLIQMSRVEVTYQRFEVALRYVLGYSQDDVDVAVRELQGIAPSASFAPNADTPLPVLLADGPGAP